MSKGQPFVGEGYAGSISTPVHVTALMVQILGHRILAWASKELEGYKGKPSMLF